MEGVERYKVKLLPHSPLWDAEFSEVKEELKIAFGDNALDIQHVGSTAIQSICAKPILDIAVQLKSVKAMEIEALKAMGYDYCGARNGNPNYHLFVLRGENQISLRHIHCYDKEEKEFDRLVGFRDYLNSHTAAAVQYENLKKELAEKNSDDRVKYTQGKEAFIQSIYDKIALEDLDEVKLK